MCFFGVGYKENGVGSRRHAVADPLRQSDIFCGAGVYLFGAFAPAEEGAGLTHFPADGFQRGTGEKKGCLRSQHAGINELHCKVSCGEDKFVGLSQRCRIGGGGVCSSISK